MQKGESVFAAWQLSATAMHWFSSHISESVYIGSLTMYIRESAFAWDCLLLPCFAKSESVCAVGLSAMATALLHYPCR